MPFIVACTYCETPYQSPRRGGECCGRRECVLARRQRYKEIKRRRQSDRLGEKPIEELAKHSQIEGWGSPYHAAEMYAVITREWSAFCGEVLERLAHDEVLTLDDARAAAEQVARRYGYARIERWRGGENRYGVPKIEIVAQIRRKATAEREDWTDLVPDSGRVIIRRLMGVVA